MVAIEQAIFSVHGVVPVETFPLVARKLDRNSSGLQIPPNRSNHNFVVGFDDIPRADAFEALHLCIYLQFFRHCTIVFTCHGQKWRQNHPATKVRHNKKFLRLKT